jgi:hypothetical protein
VNQEMHDCKDNLSKERNYLITPACIQ